MLIEATSARSAIISSSYLYTDALPPRVEAPAGERSLEDLKAEHGLHLGSRHGETRGELSEQSPLRNYVRDLVLGFNDGVVSVYAVTAGVAGAALATGDILLTGVAASVAGALSMGAGEYISTKSQAEFYRAERSREEEHLAKWPHLERQELRESFEAKGIEPPLLDQVVDALSANREKFLDYMMRDEFGVGKESERSPLRAAFIVMGAFLLGALCPVLPFAFADASVALTWRSPAVLWSSGLSLAGLFLAGVARAKASRLPSLRAGAEMVGIGLLAAGITYGIGVLVGGFV